MPAKAGIQKRFAEALDSRLRGNDTVIQWRLTFGCAQADRPFDHGSKQ
jgi:hypothetical protein